MFFRHFIEILVNPFTVFLLLFTGGVFSAYYQGTKQRWFFAGLLIFLLVISTGFLPYYLTQYLEQQYPPLQKADGHVRWIVVLSGGQTEQEGLSDHEQLYSASLKRVVAAIALAQRLPQAHVLLSGGGYHQKKAEALRMQTMVSWFPQIAGRVVLETGSINTEDQARLLKPILGKEPFYLVTSATHMPRAILLCQAQGLHPLAAPTDYTLYGQGYFWQKMLLPSPRNLVYLSVSLHEILGIIWFKMHRP